MTAMWVLGAYAVLLALLVKRRRFVAAYAVASLALLGAVQVELFLAEEITGEVFVYYVTPESLLMARRYLLVVAFAALPLALAGNRSRELSPWSVLHMNQPLGLTLLLLTAFLSAVAALSSLGTYETGRPSFRGIGIVLGLLVPISAYLIARPGSPAAKATGIAGLVVILVYSRILVAVCVGAMFFFALHSVHLTRAQLWRVFAASAVFLFCFLIIGQIKHAVGLGVGVINATVGTLGSLSWLTDTSRSEQALGLTLNYIIGVELGDSLADCIQADAYSVGNILYTFHEAAIGFVPGFLRDSLQVDLTQLPCQAAIVKPILVDFYRSFGPAGVALFAALLWSYVAAVERAIARCTSRPLLLLLCLLAANTVFLVRGSIGAFVSFTFMAIIGGVIGAGMIHVTARRDAQATLARAGETA